jgi:HEAT repeat protein
MKLKFLTLPALFAFAAGAFSADPVTPAPAPTLDSLVIKLSGPIDKDSFPAQLDLEKLTASAARPGAEPERAALARELCEKAFDGKLPQTVRALILRQLALIGGAESVKPLAGLLADPDPQISECARLAMEKNPSPAAGAVLLANLQKGGEIRWQIGLINSLGERRAATAVDTIAERLKDDKLAAAALSALGKIGSPEAVRVLRKSLPNPAAVDALIVAARRLDAGSAAGICAGIYDSSAAPGQRAAALSLLAVDDAAQARKAIPAAFASGDPSLQLAAVAGVQKIYGAEASAFLASQLPNLKPVAIGIVLRALDASAEKDVIALADANSDPDVNAAVIETLGRIGSSASVPVLLRLAGDKAPGEQTPLGVSLATIKGPGAEEAIQKAAASGDPKTRVVAITVLGWRNSHSAAPALAAYAAEPDAAVSRAACLALKTAGTDNEIMPVVKLILGGKAPATASVAIRGIASRSADRHGIAAQVLGMCQGSSGPELIQGLEILSFVGGPDALKTVVGYTSSSTPGLAEGALRTLCKWPDFDGVQPLLAYGGNAAMPEPLRLLALNAVERLILSSVDTVPALRVGAALDFLKTAWRDQEKGIAISALASIPYRAAADAMLPLTADEHLKSLACQGSLNLGDLLIKKRDRGSAKKLAEAVIKANPGPDLVKRAETLATAAGAPRK